jgi:hypothetical protein
MHEKLTDIVFDQIDTQLNMMAHNLSENSTNVAPARIIQPPNEKVTNSGIQSENWQEMETPNNGEGFTILASGFKLIFSFLKFDLFFS